MPILNGEVYDLDHHKHPLKFKEFNSRYICDGCKEPGLHSGYCCDGAHCNFVLHEQCIESIGNHFRFNRFPECDFEFARGLQIVTIGAGGARTIQLASCDVCAKPINGYAYTHSRGSVSVSIHPSCATLPHIISDGTTTMKLVSGISSSCFWCENQSLPGLRNSWAYISTTSTSLQIHVGCVKDFFLEHSNQGSTLGGNIKISHPYLALPSSSNSTVSSSNSTAIVPSMRPSTSNSTATARIRKREQIKKKIKVFGHLIAAVIGPAKTGASLAAAIATIAPAL